MALRRTLGLLAFSLSACVVHRGPSWERAPQLPQTSGDYALVVVGNPGAPGRHARHVAVQLAQVLADERAAGRKATVLWLGDLVMSEHPDRGQHCARVDGAWSREGSQDLAQTVREHTAAGGASYAVLGPSDRRCGLDEALRQEGDGPHPWRMPDDHYVVRVAADGSTSVVSVCDDGGCRITPAPADARLELVVVDATVWTDPPASGPARVRAEASQRRLDQLVSAATVGEGPPRILVSAVPVETAGMHGHGGRGSEATWHNLPPALAEALSRGAFAGSIGAYDHSLSASPDISEAIRRSDAHWVDRPIFQVVSGSASWPDARAAAGARRLEYFRGNAYRPAVYSDHAGFVVLRPRSEYTLGADLWARRLGKWQREQVTLALRPAPHGDATKSPITAPCLRCDPTPGPHRQ